MNSWQTSILLNTGLSKAERQVAAKVCTSFRFKRSPNSVPPGVTDVGTR